MEQIYTHSYPNNINVIYQYTPETAFFDIAQLFKIGARDFDPGLLHFFEHCAFRHPENLSEEDYAKTLQETPLYKNASTNLEYIHFRQSGLAEDWKVNMYEFFRCHENNTISDNDIERERKRIIHEIHEHHDNNHVMYQAGSRHLYSSKEYRADVLGSPEHIQNHTKQDLERIMHISEGISFTIVAKGSTPYQEFFNYLNIFIRDMGEKMILKESNTAQIRSRDKEIKLPYEQQALVHLRYFNTEEYSIEDYMYAKMLSYYYSYKGGSKFSEYIKKEYTPYSYGSANIFYQHGHSLFFNIHCEHNQEENLIKDIKKHIKAEEHIPEDTVHRLKKIIKAGFLEHCSNHSNAFEAFLERYELFNQVHQKQELLDIIEQTNSEKLYNYHQKFFAEAECVSIIGK